VRARADGLGMGASNDDNNRHKRTKNREDDDKTSSESRRGRADDDPTTTTTTTTRMKRRELMREAERDARYHARVVNSIITRVELTFDVTRRVIVFGLAPVASPCTLVRWPPASARARV